MRKMLGVHRPPGRCEAEGGIEYPDGWTAPYGDIGTSVAPGQLRLRAADETGLDVVGPTGGCYHGCCKYPEEALGKEWYA